MNASAKPGSQRRFDAHWGWHALGLAVVLGWLGVMGLQFWPQGRHLSLVDLDYAQLKGALIQHELWMGAYQNDRKLGFVHGSVRAAGEGLALTQRSQLQVTLGGLKQPVDSSLEILLDAKFSLQRFAFKLRAGPIRLKADGAVTERGIEVDVDVGGERAHRVLPLAEPPLFDLALPYLLARQHLTPGDRFRVRVFDPQTLSNQDSLVEVVGPEAIPFEGRLVPAVHLIRQVGGVDSHSWIDSRGVLLKQQVADGLLLLREDEDLAQSGVEGMSADGVEMNWLQKVLGPKGTRR